MMRNEEQQVTAMAECLQDMGRVKVIHGPNDEIFDGLVGHQVATVERSLVNAFNIPPTALPFVNGEPVERQYRLQRNETLEFVLPAGMKGVLEPEELAILERIAVAAERIASLLENTTEQTDAPASQGKDRLRLDLDAGHAILDGVRYALDPEFLAILNCLLQAHGSCVSRAEMRAASEILKHETHIERLISRLKKQYPPIGNMIQSKTNGYRLVLI